MPGVWDVVYHVRCGLHSGLPLCCILWYVTGWHVMSGVPIPRAFRAYWRLIRLSGRIHGVQFGHIPCPACIVRGLAVHVLECDCDPAEGQG